MKIYSLVINWFYSFLLLNWFVDCIVIRLRLFFLFYNEYFKYLNCLYLEICLIEWIVSICIFILIEKLYISIYYILVFVIIFLVKYCIIMEVGWLIN